MEVKAQHKNVRMSARKLRTLRGVVCGLPAGDAEAQLKYRPSKAALTILQVLRSAVANAKHNHGIDVENLKVADVVIDGGFTLKRYRPSSKGSAKPILRRTAHVSVVVEEVGKSKKRLKKAKKTQIETITAEDFAKNKAPTTEVTAGKNMKSKQKNEEPRVSKSEEAYQKVKMMQQGGDTHKTHRRKSMD